MPIQLPQDPRERVKAMVNLARGNPAVYTVDGKRITVVPRQAIPRQTPEKPKDVKKS